ncbi:hypothetical protein GW17_00007397, partial [Ensete ventricosum]
IKDPWDLQESIHRWAIVQVGRSVPVPGADLALKSIHNVKEALPEIWQDGKQTEPVLAATAVEETTVLA